MFLSAFFGQFFFFGHYARGDVSDRPTGGHDDPLIPRWSRPSTPTRQACKANYIGSNTQYSAKYYEPAARPHPITPSRRETALRLTIDRLPFLEFAPHPSNSLSRRRPPTDPLSIPVTPLVSGHRKSDSLPKMFYSVARQSCHGLHS